MKIQKSTKEQIDKFPFYIEKWFEIGHSTGDCNIEIVKENIKLLYEFKGLREPSQFIVCNSPLSGITCLRRENYKSLIKGSVRGSVWSSVRDSVRASVRDFVWDSVEDSVRASVRDSMGYSVKASVWDSMRDSMGYSVKDSMRDSIGYSVEDSVWNFMKYSCFGTQEAGFFSYYDYFNTEFNFLKNQGLDYLIKISTHCGWWIPFDNLVIIQHKPDYIKLDNSSLAHCESGKAVEYRDGFGFSAWHGTRIPDKWVTDKTTITTDILLRNNNIELRRIACEIVGWDKAIKLMNAKEIDVNVNPEIGTLLMVEIPDIGKEKFIRVKCGTGRYFSLPVPPEIETAQEAQNWMWQTDNYNPSMRT